MSELEQAAAAAVAAWERDGANYATFCQRMDALREALAAHRQAEPVAWMVYTADGQSLYVTDNPSDIKPNQRALPLYTAPGKGG